MGLRDLRRYLNNPLPTAPAAVAPPQLTDWGMLGNDRYGDCTIAGAAHLVMANALQNNETVPTFTTDEVVQAYLTLGHGQDQGLVEASVLSTWRQAGLFGEKIAGYAPLDPRNAPELRSTVAAFGGSYLGVAVPATMQQQFGVQPFDLTHTSSDRDIIGGHCIPVVGYDVNHCYVVTWGRLWPATWDWLGTYLEEAWAVLTAEDARVKVAELQADLDKLVA